MKRQKAMCSDAGQNSEQIFACESHHKLKVKVCRASVNCDVNHTVDFGYCNRDILKLVDKRKYSTKEV